MVASWRPAAGTRVAGGSKHLTGFQVGKEGKQEEKLPRRRQCDEAITDGGSYQLLMPSPATLASLIHLRHRAATDVL